MYDRNDSSHYYKSMIMIVSYAPNLALALASVINYDCKWRHNLKRHLLTIVMCLWNRPLELYSQNFIFFPNHEWAQQAWVFHNIRLEMFSSGKHSGPGMIESVSKFLLNETISNGA